MLQYAYNTYNEGCRLQCRSTIYRQRLSIPVSIHLATSGSRAIYSSTLGIIGSQLQCQFIINPQQNIFIYHIIKQSTCKRLYQPTYIINVLKYTYILSYNNIYCNTQYNEITHLNRNLRYHSYTHIFMGNSFTNHLDTNQRSTIGLHLKFSKFDPKSNRSKYQLS